MGEFGIRARSFLPQRDDGKDGEQASRDERALDETSRDIAESEELALPPQDREQHDGGADVRDDEEQLQERSQEDAVVGAGDVAAGVVENRLKEIDRPRWRL